MSVILVSIPGVFAPRSAHACSCGGHDATILLDAAPAAFTGTLISVDRGLYPFFGDGVAVNRYQIDTWVKGDLGHYVDVYTEIQGAACGLGGSIGTEIGLVVFIEWDGRVVGNSCAVVPPADLIAAGTSSDSKRTSQWVPPLFRSEQPEDTTTGVARVSLATLLLGVASFSISKRRKRIQTEESDG